ncbi:class I SAM-dependent methyltransferase [Aliikangiella sp. IMCC44359]|uniref:class I SAM-dependent methyltransferase n=1 Tax=Aliikangiella sp. IMCC44359 TaxID=3459125 RepID=UPI00403AF796
MKKLDVNNKSLTFLSKPIDSTFENAYLDVRNKENRILTDELVSILPRVSNDNLYFKEWCIREQSANRVLDYLSNVNYKSSDWVLDIGCGNGWFSHLIAQTVQAKVLAIDINQLELEQAVRVFNRDNLFFAYLDVFDEELKPEQFTTIIFNSSFQYFKEPNALLERCLGLMVRSGELHIVDTPFYQAEKVDDAKLRSRDYYQQIGAEDMIAFYNHHNYEIFSGYNIEVLYRPPESKTMKSKNDSPFPWLKICR